MRTRVLTSDSLGLIFVCGLLHGCINHRSGDKALSLPPDVPGLAEARWMPHNPELRRQIREIGGMQISPLDVSDAPILGAGDAYRITVVEWTNRVSMANLFTRSHVLVVRNRQPFYIETDDDALGFLSGVDRATLDVSQVVDLVRAFATLRFSALVFDDPAPTPETRAIDWTMRVSQKDDRWIVRCVLGLDPMTRRGPYQSFDVCVFTIQHNGQMRVTRQHLFGAPAKF